MRRKVYEHRGKPVVHRPVVHIETGKVYKTYVEAASAVGGNRWGVRYTAMNIQKTHMGQHFRYATKEEY